MKASEIREMTAEEMEDKLTELHTELRDLRFQDAVGQFTATSRPREIRRDIARIHTIRTEMEAAEA
ncbi:MAG: 50S ribosomal protein L29 [Thermomicrobiales bacterium]|nr:50S ribosomal protein L29 [Thermomicrobiales bacterium]MCO5218782.1 50S ribosomal protein L29 [Thermomicrobiales bacterium]MCO5225999.1 50S ribosomal protein L29 [Thermomicrobiales bacterium]MCO5229132.1 50S ribosomal protein L29 [Thermomicrobiales bacterium]